MINIVCALHCEAKPIIDYFKLSLVSDSLFPIFTRKKDDAAINLVVTGVGKVAIASAMAYLYVKMGEKKNASWLNYGIAGHKNATLGDWFNVNKVTDVSTGQNWYPARFQTQDCQNAALSSVDVPMSNYESNLLIDMEASAFMFVALKFSSIELIQIMKIISDNEGNPIEAIDKNHVKFLLNDNISPLLTIIDLLQKKEADFEVIYAPDILYEQCLASWHFTQYQKKELVRLTQRFRLVGNATLEGQLKKCEDSKQAIAWFKNQLANVSVEFS